MSATAATPTVDLTEVIRPGDGVIWPQGTGEPRTLTEAFVRDLPAYPGLEVFFGGTFSDTFERADLSQTRVTVGGAGANTKLAPSGELAVIPCHVSTLPRLIEAGLIRADVVLIQVSPAAEDGSHSLGVIADYVHEAIAAARVVVAEVNERMPRTGGDTRVEPGQIDRFVHSDRPLVSVTAPPPGPVEEAIAGHVAELVPNGATLEVGFGTVPNAILACLGRGHRDLGLHTGAVGDEMVELIACGAMTNARKPIDTGVAVAGALFGTERLYDFVHENPGFEVRALAHTHDPATIAQLGTFIAINGALEVDLTGQVNAETLRGRHVGAVGGQVDFVRAAMATPGGRSIIALPATAARGRASRIVGRLADGVVTTARSDADVVVTEHGAAQLRGCSLPERARRLIAIADPAFRDELTETARNLC